MEWGRGNQKRSGRSALRIKNIIHSYFNLYKISWIDHVRNEEVLFIAKEEGNILRTIKIGKANWIGYMLRGNCLLKHIIEGNTENRLQVMGRRGGRRKLLLNDLKEGRGYCKLKKEALRTAHCCYYAASCHSVITQDNAVRSHFAAET